MNKQDMRVQMPLWNIALGVVLMVWAYGVIYAVDLMVNGFDEAVILKDNGVQLHIAFAQPFDKRAF